MNRRSFLASTAATLAVPGLGHAQRTYSIPDEHQPRVIQLANPLPPNEIHVIPQTFRLYWTMPASRAIEYTVGVGKGDNYEPGTFFVGAKKEWPSWTPTPDMIERDPGQYKQWEEGMPGGPSNPLGARAIYLFTPQKGDTFLRIHGTPQPWTVNSAVSNGCVRLVNSHVLHLYDLVPMKAKVVLYPKGGSPAEIL